MRKQPDGVQEETRIDPDVTGWIPGWEVVCRGRVASHGATVDRRRFFDALISSAGGEIRRRRRGAAGGPTPAVAGPSGSGLATGPGIGQAPGMGRRFSWFLFLVVSLGSRVDATPDVPVPRIQDDEWIIAGNPDLGEFGSERQEPVDFGIWQASDGAWQLWSCIRRTREYGRTRLFHRWEGTGIEEADWRPRGIVMRAEPDRGETPGGLQAPYVLRTGGRYHLFYGDMVNICLATSREGKVFQREVRDDGTTGMFTEGEEANARDPMVLNIDGLWHLYYSANPGNRGAVYCRTTTDFVEWTAPVKVASGGEAGDKPFAAECPFVVEREPGEFYLFRTQRYGQDAVTRVYYSTDPLDFGIDEDEKHLVATLPVAAPEIVHHENEFYIASLLPGLNGIRVAPLTWEKRE